MDAKPGTSSAPPQASLTFDEKTAYDGIILALQSIQRCRSLEEEKYTTTQSLRNTALDIERAEIVRRGTLFGLHKLDDTDHLFVRHTSDRSPYIREMKRRFEIRNARGERVLFAVEENGYLINAFSFSSVNEFDYSFIDPKNGMEGFRVSSRTRLFGILGTVMRVFKGNDLLGSVSQTGHYGSTVFKLLGRAGKVKYIIKPIEDYVEGIRPSFFQRLLATDDIDIEFPSEFSILSPDESVYVGRITGLWDASGDEFPGDSISESDEQQSSSNSSSDPEMDDSRSDDDEIDESESASVSLSRKTSGTSLPSEISSTEIGVEEPDAEILNPDTCVPFRMAEDEFDEIETEGRQSTPDGGAEQIEKFSEEQKRFSRERYERFLDIIARNNNNWRWYFDGEHFGAEFNSELGSVSRALIVAVILLQYFRIHYDRHHRRNSARILYKEHFERWCILTGLICIVAIVVIFVDIYRDSAL